MKATKKTMWWRFVVIGLVAGFANGLFGGGGGLFLVPLLIRWAEVDERQAFASSVAVMFAVSAASFTVFLLQGRIDFEVAWPYVLGGAAGGVLSGILFKKMSVSWLHRLFGLLLLYGGIKAVLLL